jgi:hypothetical protein
MEKPMEAQSVDRRFFVTTLFGAAGAAAFATMMPLSSEAIAKVLLEDTPKPNTLPRLDDPEADSLDDAMDTNAAEPGEQLAWHDGYPHGTRRRRRRRVQRWRRICSRDYWNGVYRRRCRRRPVWIWLSI